jgi:hypothetical protein
MFSAACELFAAIQYVAVRLCTILTSPQAAKTQVPSAFSVATPLRHVPVVIFFCGFEVTPQTQKRQVFKLIEDEDEGTDSSRPRHRLMFGNSLSQLALL